MNGLGQPLLPRPEFSDMNPYWRDPRIKGVYPEYQPRLTAKDFYYASVWEIWRRFDVHMAYCVRQATVNTVRMNWWFDLRNQLHKHNLKEIQSEKTV